VKYFQLVEQLLYIFEVNMVSMYVSNYALQRISHVLNSEISPMSVVAFISFGLNKFVIVTTREC